MRHSRARPGAPDAQTRWVAGRARVDIAVNVDKSHVAPGMRPTGRSVAATRSTSHEPIRPSGVRRCEVGASSCSPTGSRSTCCPNPRDTPCSWCATTMPSACRRRPSWRTRPAPRGTAFAPRKRPRLVADGIVSTGKSVKPIQASRRWRASAACDKPPRNQKQIIKKS